MKSQSELPTPVQTVITNEMAKIYNGKDPKTLNDDFLRQNSHSLEHLLAGKTTWYYDKTVGYCIALTASKI